MSDEPQNPLVQRVDALLGRKNESPSTDLPVLTEIVDDERRPRRAVDAAALEALARELERAVLARVAPELERIVTHARQGVEKWLGGMKGCTVIRGHARFESANTVRVGNEVLSAPRIFINVGGRAHVPDMPGVDEVPYLTNSSMLELDSVPGHLVVVGGSYVGLEFAQMFRRFGAQVTVVEQGERLVGREDEDVSQAIAEILNDEGYAVDVAANAAQARSARAANSRDSNPSLPE